MTGTNMVFNQQSLDQIKRQESNNVPCELFYENKDYILNKENYG